MHSAFAHHTVYGLGKCLETHLQKNMYFFNYLLEKKIVLTLKMVRHYKQAQEYGASLFTQ